MKINLYEFDNTNLLYAFLILLAFSLIFFSCNNNKEKLSNHATINLTVDLESIKEPQLKDVFSTIHIDTLEYTNHSVIGNPFNGKYYIYVPEKYFILADNRYVISIFDTNGKFLSSSINCIGEGPREYSILQDFNYNKHDNTMEVLDHLGNIVVYDMSFNFISKHKIALKPADRVRIIYPYEKDNYALIDDTQKSIVYLYNKKNKKMGAINYDGIIAPVTANSTPFRHFAGEIYFFPCEINNTIFIFNTKSKTFIPKYNIKSNKSINRKSVNKLKGGIEAISKYVGYESNYYSPLNRFLSDTYMITLFIKGGNQFINIYNLKTNKNSTFSKSPHYKENIPTCYFLENDFMHAIIQPDEIYDFIDVSLVENKKILNSLNEFGNPLIVKYKLKL
ncbi:6-bladed beta-propeller [Proteiniphilum sp. X52]|uniref:6-bladed beta-propeller n=1 Tax=Proteiniphilum sp. X52 TaxID=2382159 RepID=UPI000F0A2213|nr:6-bladed beta-propeller [Proteiniphilum sp. X52]RNC63290.1 6-bladed beta-propeller [Proteiniphilum sp. X52]